MKRRRRAVVIGTLILLAAGLIYYLLLPGPLAFAAGRRVALGDYPATVAGVPAELVQAGALERGRYLAEAADCEACHTVPGDVPFAGGRAFPTDFGTLYSPNITADAQTGIGAWTDAEFIRAMHEGVNRKGEHLYPAFPFAAYTLLTDEDVLAIKAYLFSLPGVRRASPEHRLRFPFNRRELMTIWAVLYNPDRRFEAVAERSPAWNRGAYLAEALGHCGDCHTPRSPLQALNNRRKFAGGMAEGWRAYNLTSDVGSGVGSWSAAEMEEYLRSGHSLNRGSAFGPMAEAVHLSLQRLAPSDISAIVEYVRSVPPISSRDLPAPKLERAPVHPAQPVAADRAHPEGRDLYASLCAGCHSWAGANDYTPHTTLTGSRAINDPTAINVAMALLHGAAPLPGSGAGASMPSFAAWTDAQIADVSNYVIARFGAAPSAITADDVHRLRSME